MFLFKCVNFLFIFMCSNYRMDLFPMLDFQIIASNSVKSRPKGELQCWIPQMILPPAGPRAPTVTGKSSQIICGFAV